MSKKKSLRKKQSIKKKKPFFENNVICGIFLFIFLFCVSFYFFFFYSFFQVESIEIKNSVNIKEEALISFIDKKIQTNFLFFNSKSIFFFSSKRTKENILAQTSVIKDISIKKIFPAKIKVELIERVPVAFWCKMLSANFCFYIDKEGIVFQKSQDIKKNSLILVKKDNFSLGEKVIDTEHLRKIFLLKKELNKIGLETTYFNLLTEKTIEAFTKEEWKILFSFENIEEELKNLKLILEKLSKGEREDLNYIDLRFGDRVYYK